MSYVDYHNTVYYNRVYHCGGTFYKTEAEARRIGFGNYLTMSIKVYLAPKGVNVARLNQRSGKGGHEYAIRDCKQLTSIPLKG